MAGVTQASIATRAECGTVPAGQHSRRPAAQAISKLRLRQAGSWLALPTSSTDDCVVGRRASSMPSGAGSGGAGNPWSFTLRM